MKPLVLSGRADFTTGYDDLVGREVLRARAAPAFSISDIGKKDVALVRSSADAISARTAGFESVLAVGDSGRDAIVNSSFKKSISLPNDFEYVDDGDVFGFHPASKRIRVHYRRASKHNAFLVTERCNHYCLMCSQPPKNVDDSWILDDIAASLDLMDCETQTIGFTGGEPLLDWQRFISILAIARDRLPNTAVHVLTNGRAFAIADVTQAWSALGHFNLCAGIPLYSAVDSLHDYVVQAKGAFDETVLGILRLKDEGQRVEVRVVLHKLTAGRLLETCTWLARNMPFLDHVALMGLENTGFAIANENMLWIDPLDYRAELAKGIEILVSAGLKTSIYNLPLCLLDRSAWPYAVQSISDWKNAYLPECEHCAVRSKCSGFFTTGRLRKSRGIQPVPAHPVGS
ncbi:His-Xaa-Ser system radical SAM maturase HxsC [Rhizobiales bacterium GAS191]|nr:His-Xaa-Ser system radical SAM maturase HxsC [Rhizobiales bacterium GAS191]